MFGFLYKIKVISRIYLLRTNSQIDDNYARIEKLHFKDDALMATGPKTIVVCSPYTMGFPGVIDHHTYCSPFIELCHMTLVRGA